VPPELAFGADYGQPEVSGYWSDGRFELADTLATPSAARTFPSEGTVAESNG